MEKEVIDKVKVWGAVKDKQGVSIEGICVRLVKKSKCKKRTTYQMIAEGWTNKSGIYTFEVDKTQLGQYKIIVVDQRREEGGRIDVFQ